MAKDLTTIPERSLLQAVLQMAEQLDIPVCTDDYDLILAVLMSRRQAVARAAARSLRLVDACQSN